MPCSAIPPRPVDTALAALMPQPKTRKKSSPFLCILMVLIPKPSADNHNVGWNVRSEWERPMTLNGVRGAFVLNPV